MINPYYLYPFSVKRLFRLVFLMLSPGVITILCHAEGFSPGAIHSEGYRVHDGGRDDGARGAGFSGMDLMASGAAGPGSGPAPTAHNDDATTPEDISVVIYILDNDKSGKSATDDDKDDDAFAIAPSTVDLNPDETGRQASRATVPGMFSVDENGHVTFLPSLNYYGSTSIQYTVESLAGAVSNRATISVTVTAVNDAPVITGVSAGQIAAEAGQPVTVPLEYLLISDPDNSPGDFSLIILPGANYTASGNTVTPAAGFAGVLPVNVQVSDGIASSQSSTVELLVTDENVPPEITGQNAVITQEDQAVMIKTEHLIVNDPDNNYPDDFTVQVGEGENYTVSAQTVTPAPDFSGTLSVPVTVNDGESTSEAFVLQITVAAVNDRPLITGQQPDPVTTRQDEPVTLSLENLIVSDPDHSFPAEFTLTVMAGENYTISGNTITPAAGFSGTLTVQVTVNDPVESSDPYALKVSVIANSPPVITGQTTLGTNEEVPLAIGLSNVVVSDPDDAYPQDFTLRLLPGDNYTLEGNTVSPAVNFHGTLRVPVVVNDGSNDSAPFDLEVTVHNVNDAPVITGQAPLSAPENEMIALELAHLAVADPDNVYPAGFSLSVLAGTNYSVSGNVITPVSGFNGALTVEVFVNDGTANSNIYPLQITVAPVNDPPVITGQRALEMAEGTSVSLSLQDLTVSDPDNTYPDDFSLAIQPGADYTFSGNTVTPSPDFAGALTVHVAVSDGSASSQPFALTISVLPVNDPPEITGPAVLTTNEDVPLTIGLNDLQVTDPDNAYPSGFTLVVFPGSHYTQTGNTVVPEPNFNGTLSVQVQVGDGSLTSNIFSIAVDVLPVNDAPVITGQVPVETPEDTPVNIQLSHLTVLDVDNAYPAGFTLVVSPGVNYTVSGSSVTPAANFNGTLNVNVSVNDGTHNSDTFIFQIQVGNSNDAPVITGQTALATEEEKPVTLSLTHLTVADPDNQYPGDFTLLVSSGTHYTVSGQTITPAVNFAGTLSVPVRVNDGINNSATFDFKLQVNQINDPPVFAAIPNQKIQENAAAGSITITGISKGPMEEDQQLTFVGTSGNTTIIRDPVIQYSGGSTATLSYSVVPNTSGVVTITVVAIDNGPNTPPHQNSYSANFQIEVVEINSPPTLDPINNITVLEDAEQQNITLTGITAGPGESQSLSVAVSPNGAGFFELLEVVYTSPGSSGLLRFKPKPDISGTVQLSVTVTDNGSGVSPHVNSITRIFSLVVQPVNDPPVFVSQPLTLAVINEEYVYGVKVIDPDGEQITLSAPGKPAWATFTAAGNGSAVLKGKPPAGVLGNVEVRLSARDAAATVEQSFMLYVNVRPAISALSLMTEEDTPVAFPAGFFTSGYTDMNDNPLSKIVITRLPAAGEILLSSAPVKAGDTLHASSLSNLVYVPRENYSGMDSFGWNASDGYHFSLTQARVDLSVLPINDPPGVILENDTLHYEVNGEPAFVLPLVDVVDPDNDSLTQVSVGFHARNYHPEMDLLQYQNTPNIRGTFNFQSGVLTFSGAAPLDEYRTALQSIQYLHRNTIDPLLEPKTLYLTLNDGQTESGPVDKVIMLQYTFVEFEIPSGFTPNGDHANDTWIIDRPGGGLEEMDRAIISIYNKQGVLVYRSQGFDRAWDGTVNGELLPADTYFYTIDLQLRNRKTYKGIVTILR